MCVILKLCLYWLLVQGKFIRINFDAHGYIAGANIETCKLLCPLFVFCGKSQKSLLQLRPVNRTPDTVPGPGVV